MIQFIFGAVSMLSLVVSMFFLQFYLKLKDPFFAYFSLAFLIFALERLWLMFFLIPEESHPLIYLFRLAGFAIILFAIYKKNKNVKQA